MPDIVTIILIALAGIVAGAFLVWLFARKGKESGATGTETLSLLLERMDKLSDRVDEKMGKSFEHVQHATEKQFSESRKIYGDLLERLTRLDETNKQVVNVTDQLQSLQDILKNPKQRGVLGEYYLEALLKNVLPPGSYEMQYAFK